MTGPTDTSKHTNMKRVIVSRLFLTGFLIFLLNGCVSAGKTIAVVNGQTDIAAEQLQVERYKNRQLLRDRNQLEAKLADLKAKRKSLEASDPVGNRSEIKSLDREIAKLQHDYESIL